MRRTLLGIAVLLVLGVCLWGFWLEPTSLRVRSYRLEIPHWPETLADLRVAVIADLHVGSPFNDAKRLAKVVERTNATGADLILIAGDFLVGDIPGGAEIPYSRWIYLLKRLSAPLGVYGVLGNQDLVTAPVSLRQQLLEIEFGLLEDQAVKLERAGAAFWLVGVSDFLRGRHDLVQAFAAIDDESPVLLLTHNPALLHWIPERVSLTIAAHTHGGQIALPFLGPLIAPLATGRRLAAGDVVDEDGKHVFVNTGIGTSVLPIRFGVPPEISVLELFPPEARRETTAEVR